MMKSWITGVRSVELGVTDLERATRFYCDVWGLQQVAAGEGTRYFRAAGAEHHVLCLRQANSARLLGITLAAADTARVDALCARARESGVEITAAPRALPAVAGGGHGATLLGPEGLLVTVAAGVEQLAPLAEDRSKPSRLTHIVINSADVPAQARFFCDLLGFRLSDSTHMMDFLSCAGDHHSLALARGDGLSLNHAAYEMADIDGLMYGAGRLIDHGHAIEWGPGRHGPGNNVFCYFVDPDGFAVEYTTGMDQVEVSHVARDAAYWSDFPRRPCRWGVARQPSQRLVTAFAGRGS